MSARTPFVSRAHLGALKLGRAVDGGQRPINGKPRIVRMPGLCGLLSTHFMRGCKRAPLVFIKRPLTVGVCARLLTRHEKSSSRLDGSNVRRQSGYPLSVKADFPDGQPSAMSGCRGSSCRSMWSCRSHATTTSAGLRPRSYRSLCACAAATPWHPSRPSEWAARRERRQRPQRAGSASEALGDLAGGRTDLNGGLCWRVAWERTAGAPVCRKVLFPTLEGMLQCSTTSS
jgi:hypothetical protein